MENKIDFLGYLEYTGNLVDEGIMDTRKMARALIGFDSALRHFAALEHLLLREIEYDIPVSIRRGSWQALIPDSIDKWIIAALGITATKYLATAATEIAKNDFKDVNMRMIFSKALCSIQWIIRIGKHLGKLGQRKFTSVQWREGNTQIGIPNDRGEYIFIPKPIIDLYATTPPSFCLTWHP